jgi:hypothetical protein
MATATLVSEGGLPIWSWSVHDGTFLPVVQAVETLRALVRADSKLLHKDPARNLELGILALEDPRKRDQLSKAESEEERVEQEASDYISRERRRLNEEELEQVVAVSEARTADGSIPLPRYLETSRPPAPVQEIRPPASSKEPQRTREIVANVKKSCTGPGKR